MIKAAVIGCGKRREGKEGWAIGHAHGDGWQKSGEDVELAAVDISEENLNAFGEKFNVPPERRFTSTAALYEAMTPDVASICTWPSLHLSQVLEAAQAGTRVIVCEKPLGLDRSEIDEMTSICPSKGSHLMVAHQRRYNALYETFREVIASGAIGSPVIAEARVEDGWDVLSWTVHWFDLASFVLDDVPTRVMAGIDHRGTRRYQHAVEDASVVFAEYEKGHQAIFITGPRSVMGTSWRFAGPEGELRLGKNGDVIVMTQAGVESKRVTEHPAGDYGLMLADAAKVVRGEIDRTRCDALNSSIGTEMAYAAHEAARTCRAVAVDGQRSRFAPLEILQHLPKVRPLVRRAVLLADVHHYDPATGLSGRDGLRDALAANVAQQVDLVEVDKRELSAGDLEACDLLVLYHTVRSATSDSTKQLIGEHVRSGRPLLVTHCGIGAYSDWPEFRVWIGRHWVWPNEATSTLPRSGHPHVPCVIEPTEALNVPWSEGWLPRDEVYVALGEAGPIEVLAKMRSGEIDEPAIWRSGTKSNVVVTLPGHRADVWDLPVMRDQLSASAEVAIRSRGTKAAAV